MSTFPIQCPCRMKHHVRKNNLESDCRALNSRNLFVLAHCLLFSFTYVLLLLWTATLVTFIHICIFSTTVLKICPRMFLPSHACCVFFVPTLLGLVPRVSLYEDSAILLIYSLMNPCFRRP